MSEPQAVRFGIYVPQVGYSYQRMLEVALRVEQAGLSSLWLYDHLYSPGQPDHDSFEGWTLATALLAQTTTLRVGHLVLNANFRHPVLLARMCSTLDVISRGRLNIGLGSGSYQPEHEEGGFPWGPLSERSARLAEGLEILTRMFEGARTTFQGTYYQVNGVPNLPTAVQRPRPAIYVGGVGAKYTLPLVARHANHWNLPTYGLAKWDSATADLDRECHRIGRDPDSLGRSLEAVMAVGQEDAGAREAVATATRRYAGEGWGLDAGGLVGTPAQVSRAIRKWMGRGFTEFVFFLADRGRGQMLDLLVEEVLPQLR